MNDNFKSNKVILHIDVDSFFVSCEVALRPELLNKQVAVSTDTHKSIVTALSYEAKAKGAKVPWKLSLVKKHCKDLIILEPNMFLYQNYAKKIYDFLIKNYSDSIQIVSIDEWYIDATKIWKKFGSINNLASHIQEQLWKKLLMPVSIGISYNKFLAKMATAINKPKGITFITYNNFQEILWPMDITNYYGIGKVMSKKLIEIGIKTIGDLANRNISDIDIKKIFLNQTEVFINNANGIGDSLIKLDNNILNSISNEITFMNGFSDNHKEVHLQLRKLCHKVSSRLIERNICGSHVSINLKLDNQRKSKSMKINKLINSEEDIFVYASKLMKSLWNEEAIIGIGVAISKLENSFQNLMDQSLFEEQKENSKIDNIIQNVNSKMNRRALMSGKEFTKYKKATQNKYL
ncbi:MAG: DNA polymerase IV [Mycoplasmataceae bacterium]|nr:DNA polymerase IV [Mycoplasmataceae bacterium]